MRRIKKTSDVGGHELCIGDTVTTLSGDVTGTICDICRDSDVAFVQVRPLHQSYGKGIWHSADRTMWVSASRRKNKKNPTPSRSGRCDPRPTRASNTKRR